MIPTSAPAARGSRSHRRPHRQLQHAEAVLRREAQQRQRNADLIVLRALRHHRRAHALQYLTQHVLRRGLPGAPRDRRHARGHPRPVPRGQQPQRDERVLDHDHRQPGGSPLGIADQRAGGAALERVLEELMPVVSRARERDEQLPAGQFPRVGAHAQDGDAGLALLDAPGDATTSPAWRRIAGRSAAVVTSDHPRRGRAPFSRGARRSAPAPPLCHRSRLCGRRRSDTSHAFHDHHEVGRPAISAPSGSSPGRARSRNCPRPRPRSSMIASGSSERGCPV